MRSDAYRVRALPLRWFGIAAAAMSAAAVPARAAAAQTLEYTGTVQSATGEYLFTERTTSFALFNGLSLGVGRLRFTATLPLVYQNSTAVTYVGGTPVPTGGPDAELVRQRQPGTRVPMGSGKRRAATNDLAVVAETAPAAEVVAAPGDFRLRIGDPVVQLDADLYRGFGIVRSLTIDVTAKAPFADTDEGIGTGEWDYGAGAMVALGSARTFVFANATYWVLGDMPDLRLRNSVSYGVSMGRALGNGKWSLLGSVTGATSMIEGADPPLSAGVGIGYLLDSGQGVNAGVSVGVSESSPGFSSYVGWRVPIWSGAR